MTEIIFSIPFTGKRSEEQWAIAQRRLAGTLASIANQTDSNWTMVISGHERPEIPLLDDPRVTFLTLRQEKPADKNEFIRDKTRKQRSNFDWIAARGGGDVVMTDADDLFHRELVAFIRKQDHPNGHSLQTGYVFDTSNAKLAPIPGAWSKTFDMVCGSSSVLRLAPEEFTGDESRLRKLGSHNTIFSKSEAIGRPLNPITHPLVIYVLGGLETASANVVRTPERQSRLHEIISKRAIPITDEIVQSFSLQPLLDECKTSAFNTR